jgi:single-stranded DNA-binding protein
LKALGAFVNFAFGLSIRAKDGEALQWWNVVAFSESAQAELMRLRGGDAISVQGAMQAGTYEKDGETRLSLGVTAVLFCASLHVKRLVLAGSLGRERPSMTPCCFRRAA